MCNSTETGEWQKLDPRDRRQILEALQDRGLRLTPQREAVCEAVFRCQGHICADHILKLVSAHHSGLGMNKTTVYRALDLLLEMGLVSEHRCVDGRAQYEPASRGRHSHLICRNCGELLDLDQGLAREIRQEMERRHGFCLELESYPLPGLCPACRQ